jgi:integrase
MPAAARKVSLTDRSLRALRPAPDGRRVAVWDALMPGMAVLVSGKGKRSFYAVKRRAGAASPTWVLLGAYPVVSLAEARGKAREALAALAEGQNPASLAEARREAERERAAGTFAAVAEDFILRFEGGRVPKARGEGPLRDPRGLTAIIRREFIKPWGDRPIADIARRDVIDLVEAIVRRGGDKPPRGTRRKEGGPYAGRHALSAARRLFDWAVDRELLPASPCALVKAKNVHGTPEGRDRVLSDEELRAVWAAAEATPYPYGPLVRLLILTGQRRSEIAGASWSEVDLDRALLTIGAERMKANVGHAVPLTDTAVDLLKTLPRFAAGDFLFSGATGAKAFSGFSKAKKRLDELRPGDAQLPVQPVGGGQLVDLNEPGVQLVGEIAPYTLHDLRRTVRTRLSELVSVNVAERVIAHTLTGVHKVYDLHTYDDEKREALERWERRLLAILAPEPEPESNVVAMTARARG